RMLVGGSDPYMIEDGAGGAWVVARGFVAIYLAHLPPVLGGGSVLPSNRESMWGHLSAQPPRHILHDGFIVPVVIPDSAGGAFVSFSDNQRAYTSGYV